MYCKFSKTLLSVSSCKTTVSSSILEILFFSLFIFGYKKYVAKIKLNRPIMLSYLAIIYLRLFRSAVFRKYKIIVLSDEIYGQLTFSGNHQPLAKVSGLERLISILCY